MTSSKLLVKVSLVLVLYITNVCSGLSELRETWDIFALNINPKSVPSHIWYTHYCFKYKGEWEPRICRVPGCSKETGSTGILKPGCSKCIPPELYLEKPYPMEVCSQDCTMNMKDVDCPSECVIFIPSCKRKCGYRDSCPNELACGPFKPECDCEKNYWECESYMVRHERKEKASLVWVYALVGILALGLVGAMGYIFYRRRHSAAAGKTMGPSRVSSAHSQSASRSARPSSTSSVSSSRRSSRF